MNIREIINTVLNAGRVDSVIDIIHETYYSSDPKDWTDFCHTNIMRELLELKPDDELVDDHTIILQSIMDDDEEEVRVYLSNTDGEELGLDLIPWEKLVNISIDDRREGIDVYDTLSHILWEITFYGISSSQVARFRDDLVDQIDEIKANPDCLIEWTDFDKDMFDE
jgi:hypothetical protein